MSKAWKKKALELHFIGELSWRSIAKEVGKPKSTVSDYLRLFKNSEDYLNEVSYEGNKPKVLFYDLETSMIKGYFWGLWQQNISIGAIVDDWYTICYSAKWMNTDVMIHDSVHHHDPLSVCVDFKNNEHYIIKSLWKLIDEADIIIAYNGKRFDRKKMNAKFLEYGLPEPSPYKVIDPMLIVKGKFALTSNKMDFVAKYVSDNEEGKLKTGLQLWIDCMNNDIKALDRMLVYCDEDIEVLIRVYMAVRHWDSNAPNMALYYDDDEIRCNGCGSSDLTVIEGKSHNTNLSKFSIVRCNNCSKILKTRTNLLSKDKKKSLLMNT